MQAVLEEEDERKQLEMKKVSEVQLRHKKRENYGKYVKEMHAPDVSPKASLEL